MSSFEDEAPHREECAKTEHQVGNKKPPLHSRFKPGESGNRNGRPIPMLFDKYMSNPAVDPTDGWGRASAADPSRRRMRRPTSVEARRELARSETVYRGDAADTMARAGSLLRLVIHMALTENKGGAR